MVMGKVNGSTREFTVEETGCATKVVDAGWMNFGNGNSSGTGPISFAIRITKHSPQYLLFLCTCPERNTSTRKKEKKLQREG
jgi:hypothetical protein